jgi:hypothetical protein
VVESTVKLVATPAKVTAVAPPKFVPVIVTLSPTSPLVGEKEVICGPGGGGGGVFTVKSVPLVPVPATVVTAIGPVVAPLGTVAVIWVFESTLKLAATPLKVTAVVPVKFVPVIAMLAPTSPFGGAKELIVGSGTFTVKFVLLVPVPAGVVTAIGPVVAPLGTVAVIWVSESTVKLAAAPLKVTSVAPVKFTPVIVTLAPT